jgi:polar amino acid transport system substrate-binding protein
MILNRLIFICFYCFLFAAPMLAAKESLTKIREKTPTNCALKVGWSIWPPYQYLSESGKPTGLQIDLLKHIASEANCTFHFVQQPFFQNISDIKNGKIDMMPDITVTDKRRLFAHFSDTYRHEIQILYVKSSFIDQCVDQSLETILTNNFRLGLAKSNFYGKNVEAIKHDPAFKENIIFLKRNNQGMAAIINGQIDGYFEDPAVIAYLSESNKIAGQVKSCHIENYASDVSLMFSKKSVDIRLVERLNQAINKIKQSKRYKKRWEW